MALALLTSQQRNGMPSTSWNAWNMVRRCNRGPFTETNRCC